MCNKIEESHPLPSDPNTFEVPLTDNKEKQFSIQLNSESLYSIEYFDEFLTDVHFSKKRVDLFHPKADIKTRNNRDAAKEWRSFLDQWHRPQSRVWNISQPPISDTSLTHSPVLPHCIENLSEKLHCEENPPNTCDTNCKRKPASSTVDSSGTDSSQSDSSISGKDEISKEEYPPMILPFLSKYKEPSAVASQFETWLTKFNDNMAIEAQTLKLSQENPSVAHIPNSHDPEAPKDPQTIDSTIDLNIKLNHIRFTDSFNPINYTIKTSQTNIFRDPLSATITSTQSKIRRFPNYP